MGNTYLEYEGQRITSDTVKRFLDWHNLLPQAIPMQSLDRLSLLKFPNTNHTQAVVIIAQNGKPIQIVSGQQQLQQAKRGGKKQIDGYIIDIKLLPQTLQETIAAS